MKKFNIAKKDFYLLGRFFPTGCAYGEYLNNNKRFVWCVTNFMPIKKDICVYDMFANSTVMLHYENFKISVLELEPSVNIELMDTAKVFDKCDWHNTSTGHPDLRQLEQFIKPLIMRNNLKNTKCVNNYVNWQKLQANKDGAILREHTQKQRHKITTGSVAVAL